MITNLTLQEALDKSLDSSTGILAQFTFSWICLLDARWILYDLYVPLQSLLEKSRRAVWTRRKDEEMCSLLNSHDVIVDMREIRQNLKRKERYESTRDETEEEKNIFGNISTVTNVGRIYFYRQPSRWAVCIFSHR